MPENAGFCGGCGSRVAQKTAPPPSVVPSGGSGTQQPTSAAPAPSRVQKQKRNPLFFVVIILSAVTLVGIGAFAIWRLSPSNATVTEHTVTFYLNDGTNAVYEQVAVADGESVGQPSDPAREGYTFRFWTAERPPESRQFRFTTSINEDTNLYAQWLADLVTHTVVFRLNDGTTNIHTTISVLGGQRADMPLPPARLGYEFVQWTIDVDGTTPFQPFSSIEEDLELFAHWQEEVHMPEAPLPGVAGQAESYVLTSNLHFRAAPNTDAQSFEVVRSGTTVQVIEAYATHSDGRWWHSVSHGGRTGYMAAEFMVRVSQ